MGLLNPENGTKSTSMNTYPMKRVTIVCESLAREPVLKMIESMGAHGWTLFSVQGSGHQGERPSDIPEFSNIQVEVIVPPKVSDSLLQGLQSELFKKFAMVAYEQDIRVLRPEKF